MAKLIMSASIDEKILEQAKAIAERDRRSFSTIVQIALEELIRRYEKLSGLSLTTPAEAPATVEEVTA